MTALVAQFAFSTVDPEGNDIHVPKGSRVEEGDWYHTSYPEAFLVEEERPFFGRINPANGQVQATQARAIVTPPEPDQNLAVWLQAEKDWLASQDPAQPQDDPKPAKAAPRSSLNRPLPPPKK